MLNIRFSGVKLNKDLLGGTGEQVKRNESSPREAVNDNPKQSVQLLWSRKLKTRTSSEGQGERHM